jgi:hypothetical protein
VLGLGRDGRGFAEYSSNAADTCVIDGYSYCVQVGWDKQSIIDRYPDLGLLVR